MKNRIFLFFLLTLFSTVSAKSFCDSTNTSVPISNKKIIWKLIEESFENAGIPSGDGKTIKIDTEKNGNYSLSISQIATEFFKSKDYKISIENDTERKILINIDKLQITLLKSEESKNQIQRKTEAEINFTLIDNSGEKKVYSGKSSLLDKHDKKYLNILSVQENGVKLVNLTDSSFFTKVKPVAVGVSITLLVWFLYSFRG